MTSDNPGFYRRRIGDMVVTAIFDLARASRRNAFARAASECLLTAGMHMDFPCFGHVVTDGDAYRWIAEPYRRKP